MNEISAFLKQKKEQIKSNINTVFSHEPWWVEFWSAVAAIFWAYLSRLSGDSIYSHIIYLELSLIASAQFWQIFGATIGTLQLLCLIINNYKLRWIMCFFAAWFWAFLTVAVMQSEPHPPGLALYTSYTCINLLSMVKLARSHV